MQRRTLRDGITLTPAQQAEIGEALRQAFAEVAAMREMTLPELRQLHTEAARGRQMTRAKNGPSDAELLAEVEAVQRELRERGQRLKQSAICLRIAAEFNKGGANNIAPTTVRDRLLTIKRRGIQR